MIAIVAGHRVTGTERADALHFYDSPYYNACMTYALEHIHENRIFILSRTYGLVRTRAVIGPRDKMLPDDKDCIDDLVAAAMKDAWDADILYTSEQILALCAGPYLQVVVDIFGIDRIVAPIAGLSAKLAFKRLQEPLPIKDLAP